MKLVGVNFYQVSARIGTLDGDESYRDMLRYDLAFVNPEYPNIVALPVFRTKDGNLGGKVTTARWQSFCINIKPFEFDLEFSTRATTRLIHDADKWLTYQHYSPEFGPTDFHNLQPFSLKRYLEVKDHRDATKVEKGS